MTTFRILATPSKKTLSRSKAANRSAKRVQAMLKRCGK